MKNKVVRTIKSDFHTYFIHEDGAISSSIVLPRKKLWRVTGAVRYNNFGHYAERFTLAQVLENKIQWLYKNGKQRVHICDFDHGGDRVWMEPTHEVF